MRFAQEAQMVLAALPTRPALVVLGSTSFWHKDTAATCFAIGRRLASIESLRLVTGGMTGIGEGVARSFFECCKSSPHKPDVVHVLPRGSFSWDYGVTLFAGSDLAERREVLARLSQLYLTLEGGPGTEHEVNVALGQGANVIPVGRSGGYSGELYRTLGCPAYASPNTWEVLGDPLATPEEVACAVHDLYIAHLQTLA